MPRVLIDVMVELMQPTLEDTLANRIGRFLERQGLLERDEENSYLSEEALSGLLSLSSKRSGLPGFQLHLLQINGVAVY